MKQPLDWAAVSFSLEAALHRLVHDTGVDERLADRPEAMVKIKSDGVILGVKGDARIAAAARLIDESGQHE